jgi:hypothetical protein
MLQFWRQEVRLIEAKEVERELGRLEDKFADLPPV